MITQNDGQAVSCSTTKANNTTEPTVHFGNAPKTFNILRNLNRFNAESLLNRQARFDSNVNVMRSKFIRLLNLLAIVSVVGAGLGVLLALWTRGALTPLVLSAGMAAWHGFVLAAIALFTSAVGAKRFAKLCLIGVSVMVIQLCVTVIVGYSIYLQDIQDVHQYSQAVVFQLEAYKATHGHYPNQLSAVAASDPQPRLVKEAVLYYHTDEHFLLSVVDPDYSGRFWVYDSIVRRWKLTDY